MMPIAIDPTERRAQASAAKAPVTPLRAARTILLAGLGCAGLVGLSVVANALLSGLAGPPPARKIMVSRAAADMPDLRDGVPALVAGGEAARSSPMSAPREPAAAPAALPSAVAAPSEADTAAHPAEPTFTPRTQAAAEPAPVPLAEARPAPKPIPLPPIQNAALVPPARVASPVAAARTVALVAPSPRETTRARPAPAVSTSFAALPPEPAAHEAPVARRKPAPAVAARVKPAAAQVATAAPAAAALEAEETEVFGLKMPSLAPAGRKLVEGVQALGDAVRDLPGKF